jgi:uncharacterized membrane protein
MRKQFSVNHELIKEMIISLRCGVLTVNPISQMIISRLPRNLTVSALTLPER